ncbi:enoyl-CoA hydratase/isomerase family protein [Novosphingobium rosa]|uniref:enoyl-CoA hydratase/isomerase family protein n=1 Tax=Novosphingobium rosa TaxID=76978 RepID=UPI000833041B|nr:enoyl-CoA hydratase-related protein [Novosphingobium rosa]
MNSAETDLLVGMLSNGISRITFNRPERLNALTRETVDRFNALLDRIAADDTIRAVILTGAGRAFCAGQDVQSADARNRTAPSGLTERLHWQERFAGMAERLHTMPQLVIAAVNGPCAGAGMAIALASDMRIVTPSARFLNAAVRLGLTAGETGMSYMLPRLIGAARAFEILMTGRPVEAEEAERIGLALRIVAEDELISQAEALARQVLANSPFATRHTKRVIWENLDAPSFHAALELENRSQILASITEDYKEATAAFTEKRAPVFTGR